jgi:hypothetical protein
MKLRELYHEHGTFVGTDSKVYIQEPNGDVAKFANGDPTVISRLLADEILQYNKQIKKLNQDNISMIPIILSYISRGLKDRIETVAEYKDIIKNNDPFKLYKLIASVYLFNRDREHNFVTYHNAVKTFANLKQGNEISYDQYAKSIRLDANNLRMAKIEYMISNNQIKEAEITDDLFQHTEMELANVMFMTNKNQEFRSEYLNRTSGNSQPFGTIDEVVTAINLFSPVSLTRNKIPVNGYAASIVVNNSKNSRNNQDKKKKKPETAIKCYTCGKAGHKSTDCKSKIVLPINKQGPPGPKYVPAKTVNVMRAPLTMKMKIIISQDQFFLCIHEKHCMEIEL